MDVGHRKRILASLPVGLLIAAGLLPYASSAQQPSQPAATAPSSGQSQTAPSSDLAAQEDELIKKCNEQINVKGQFKEAEEFAKQARALSEKLADKTRIMVAKL